MLSPRRPIKVQPLEDGSPDVTKINLRTPVKRAAEKENAPCPRSVAKRSPGAIPPPLAQTPRLLNGSEGFITSSPSPRTKKPVQKSHRPSRTPNGMLFSPAYPATVGRHSPLADTTAVHTAIENCTPSRQLSPTSNNSATFSPVQLSLQENLARYGHMEQEFDDYEVDQFDPYQFIASLQTFTPSLRLPKKTNCLPPKKPDAPAVTLVLDLDETLVHCSTDPNDIPVPDFCFKVDFNGVTYSVKALKRPGFEEFMEHIRGKFEIVVFTASQRVYAEKLLDILDPKREFINYRLFRDDCVNVEGNYLKDLTCLGRDLAQTVILDNSPQAFSFQLDNGIPILSWFERPDDKELFKVCPLLDRLSVASDVRPLVREKFQLYKKVLEKQRLAFGISEYDNHAKALDYTGA